MYVQMIRLFIFSLLFIGGRVYGNLGGEIGTDLYDRLDENLGKTQKILSEGQIPDAVKIINQEIAQGSTRCENPATRSGCLKEGTKLTYSQVVLISTNLEELSKVLSSGEGGGISIDELVSVQNHIKDYLSKLNEKNIKKAQNIDEIIRIGLFSDGSIENSSFDIMYDLEKIHEILFSKKLEYPENPNKGEGSLIDILARKYSKAPSLGTKEAPVPKVPEETNSGSENTLPQLDISGSGNTTPPPLGNSGDLACVPETESSGLEQSIGNFLINESKMSEIKNFRDETLSQFQSTLQTKIKSPILQGAIPYGLAAGISGKFPCNEIFCIKIAFTSYSIGLTGGKNKSIEGILDTNLKIANEFAGSSFGQSQMTQGFWTSGIDWNLESLAHIGVKVSTRTPPFLSKVDGPNTNGSSFEQEKKKEYDEVLNQVFRSRGISDRKKKNSLISSCGEYVGAQLPENENISSAFDAVASARCESNDSGDAEMAGKVLVKSLLEKRLDVQANNFRMLASFTKSLSDEISSIKVQARKLSQKPNAN